MLSPQIVLLFLGSMICQVIGVTVLPLTRGFTQPYWATLCVAALGMAMFMLARLITLGAELGILLPLMAATVPMAAVIIGMLVYGESASPLKISILFLACGAIGLASRV